jgi:NADH-quinone oxidoreductase subunit L
MAVVACVGAVTAVFSATIGFAQNDIKKVLAYSTVSQLGYMFLATGVGAFGAGMFHLMTHAFFKALMFLGAGSVIHGMHHEQDMRKMGGLSKHMPITHFTFLMGWLAIIGMPPFAGFFSKDEILWQAFHSPRGHWLLWLCGVIGAASTAFYMTRLMCMTFWGKERFDKKHVHPHESPFTMTVPLIVLAVLSVIGGWIGIPAAISHGLHVDIPNAFEHWLEPRLTPIPGVEEASLLIEWVFMGLSVSVAGMSALGAYYLYIREPQILKDFVAKIGGLYKLVEGKYFVDELYFATIINPIVRGSRLLWLKFDAGVIDRATYLVGDLIKDSARGARLIQNGNLQQYLFYMVLGVAALLLLL